MKAIFFTIIAFFTFSALAQTSITGYVTLQNSGGKSAFPASIKSFGATSTDVDSEKGSFVLIFDKKKPGQDIQIEVERDGYEVVNKKDLATRLPKENQTDRPLKIYLCPKGQWQDYAADYYGVNLRAIERSYEAKLSELKQQLANKSIEMDNFSREAVKLAEDKESAEARAQELAEMFATANLDDATDRYVLAHRLFAEGNIDSVIIVLDEKILMAALAEANNEIREGNELISIGENKVVNGMEARAKIVEEFMVKARAHILKLEWINAEKAYDVAVHADSSNSDNWFEYAYFLAEQNQYNAAQPIYEHCLSLQKSEPDVAMVMNNLGILYTDKNDFRKAKTCYQRALEIYKRLARDNPKTYEADVAMTLNNIGRLFLNDNDYRRAKTRYLRALEIYERLSKENPSIYEPDIAITLDNFGILYSSKNDFPKAESYYLRALEIRERFAKEDPTNYEPSLASTLNNLGSLYADLNDFPKAESSYLRALEIFERLTKENPRTYEPYVAVCSNNLGLHFSEKSDLLQSELAYLRSLDIYGQLVRENPSTYEPYLASNLNNLGMLYTAQMDFPKAEKNCLHALEIFERLAKENPSSFEPKVAISLINLAIVYKAKYDYPKAEESFLRVLKIYERLAKDDLSAYEPFIAVAHVNIGSLYILMSDFVKGEESCLRAVEIYKRLAKENRSAVNIDLGKTYFSLSLSCLERLKLSKGEEKWREQGMDWLRKAKETLTIYPEDFEPRMQLEESLNYTSNELKNYSATLEAHKDLILAQESIIATIEKDGDKVEAQQKLVKIYEDICNKESENEFLDQLLASAYVDLSWCALFASDFPLAEASARKALEIDASADWVYNILATALLYQGKYKAAKTIYAARKGKPYSEEQTWTESFLGMLNSLELEGIVHPDAAKIRAFLQE